MTTLAILLDKLELQFEKYEALRNAQLALP